MYIYTHARAHRHIHVFTYIYVYTQTYIVYEYIHLHKLFALMHTQTCEYKVAERGGSLMTALDSFQLVTPVESASKGGGGGGMEGGDNEGSVSANMLAIGDEDGLLRILNIDTLQHQVAKGRYILMHSACVHVGVCWRETKVGSSYSNYRFSWATRRILNIHSLILQSSCFKYSSRVH